MKLLGKLSKLHPLIKMDRCGFKLESDWCIRDEAKFIFLLVIAIWHLSSNLVGTLRDSRGLTYGRCATALRILYRYDSYSFILG